MNQCFNGQALGIEAEATDDSLACRRDERVMAELLTLVNIRYVYLNDGTFQRTYAIVQGYRRVSISSSIQYNAVGREPDFLHLVDEFTLYVALVVSNLNVWIHSLQLWQILVERRGSVDTRLPCTKQVQVGSVDNLNLLHGDWCSDVLRNRLQTFLCTDGFGNEVVTACLESCHTVAFEGISRQGYDG